MIVHLISGLVQIFLSQRVGSEFACLSARSCFISVIICWVGTIMTHDPHCYLINTHANRPLFHGNYDVFHFKKSYKLMMLCLFAFSGLFILLLASSVYVSDN